MNRLSLFFASVLFYGVAQAQSIGIGTTTPAGILHTSSTGLAVLVDGYSLAGTANTATLAVRSARGTSTSPVAAQTGDRVGSILYSGQNSSIPGSFNNSAGIDVYADENFSVAAGGSSMRFATTPLGSVSRLDRVFITNAGDMGIGINSPAQKLDVAGTTKTINFQMTSGAAASSVMTGDASGNGSWQTIFVTASATLDFGNTSAQTSSDLTITVAGAVVGDPVTLGLPASPDANGAFTAWVSAANTVTVRFNNYSAVSINPASAIYKVSVIKQ